MRYATLLLKTVERFGFELQRRENLCESTSKSFIERKKNKKSKIYKRRKRCSICGLGWSALIGRKEQVYHTLVWR